MKEFSDFRSDTVTRPTEKMRDAMFKAVVGDDVLGDDPTVKELESLAADITGKEAGLFVPSGTMGNALALKVWTQELEEVIVESRCHIYNMESTHMTFISRVTPRPVLSNRGEMDPVVVKNFIRKPSVHIPRTSLLCIENTHNNWSGAVISLENIKSLKDLAEEHNLKIHLDGARIFNASQASGIPVKKYAELVDSMMFCLSKGLSAPVGSMLVGSQEFIDKARRVRKALGGGMRQAGVIASAGIVSLTDMTERLKEDHTRAKKLAVAIASLPGVKLDPDIINTNILIFDFVHPQYSVKEFLKELQNKGIHALPTTGGIRFVTHKDIDDEDVDKAISVFRGILK
ncbi:MAG: threonine aldolase family protein [Candidatus Aminicenantaceae bacterium]